MKAIYVLSLVVVVAVTTVSLAVNTYWTAGVGDWSNGSNWNNGEPSASSLYAFINNGGTAQITQAGEICYYLRLGDNSGDNGTVELSAMGELWANQQRIGYEGAGTFTQTGGTNAGNVLSLGCVSGSTGKYSLSTGQLAMGEECISNGGLGMFTQSGGTNTIGSFLCLARNSASRGEYSLSGTGQLWAHYERIGYCGSGMFTHSGGTNTIYHDFTLGEDFSSVGKYELSSTGQLAVNNDEYIGRGGSGTFTQSGGTNTIGQYLSLGYISSSTGEYNLSNGQLLVNRDERIGYEGTGTFTQSGGTNTIDHDLYLGYQSGGTGEYNLSGTGQLSAGNEHVGYSGTGTTGTFTQSGGTNTVNRYLFVGSVHYSTGEYNLSNGQLWANGEYGYECIGRQGTGTFTQTGGINTVKLCTVGQSSGSSGTYTMSGGTLDVRSLRISEEGEGVLNLANSEANVTVREQLYFGEESMFTAVSGSTIHMTGAAFENENTAPAYLAGLGKLTLIFEGGVEDVDPVEVAGENMGAILAGLDNNFALGTLVLGGEDVARIMLVDLSDNQPGWDGSEALYVSNLVLNPGSTIDLNGLNLYYLNGGDPKAFFYGDANLDGKVTIADFLALQNNFGQVGAWADGDFTGDEMVTIADFLILQNNWGFGTVGAASVPTIPEPASLLLLSLGALALVRRRR